MKCLLCNLPFETSNELDHYSNFHKVNPNNYFFKKLFAESKNKILRLKCFRCNEFVTTKKHKIVHNFLKHYVRGKTKPFETKRIEIKDIVVYCRMKLAVTNMVTFMIFQMLMNWLMNFLRC